MGFLGSLFGRSAKQFHKEVERQFREGRDERILEWEPDGPQELMIVNRRPWAYEVLELEEVFTAWSKKGDATLIAAALEPVIQPEAKTEPGLTPSFTVP